MTKRDDDFLTRLFDTLEKKLEKADLKDLGLFILEEGLYIALMSNLYLVSGRVKAFQDDGVTWTPLFAQRRVLMEMIISMRKMTTGTLPFSDIQPLGWATALLESWESALSAGESDDDGVVYGLALPTHMRMFMVLGLPGMLRIAVQLTRQLIQLVK